MRSSHKNIKLKSKKMYDFVNLTDDIRNHVEKSKIKEGLVNLQIKHTSASLVINECDEPLLVKDIVRHLEKWAPQDGEYHHDNFDIRTVNMCDEECDNGHSHCKALMLPTTVTLNLIDGKLQLGTYQKVFFVELDRARDREVQIQIIGD